jgi:hypothetical protein
MVLSGYILRPDPSRVTVDSTARLGVEKEGAGSFRLVDQFGGQALAVAFVAYDLHKGAGLLGGGSRGMYEVVCLD